MLTEASEIGIQEAQNDDDLGGDNNRLSAKKKSKFRRGKSRPGHVRARYYGFRAQAQGEFMLK